jgi:hypothetical protein
MATFKVGDRVRIVNPLAGYEHFRGEEGVIERQSRYPGWNWEVRCDRALVGKFGRSPLSLWSFRDFEIAPLTHPRADEFVADMERFALVSRPKELA